MGVILAKFRKEKSTQEVLEALQEKIDTLETFTVNTQQQKKRIVGNFLAVSIGVYVIAFVVFYFVYFPPTWQGRFVFFIPLLLFPIIIIQLRYLFTWYYQRKLNKNSKKLNVLRAEKKKILEQVMDKETYKVAVNLLARFADKPLSKSTTNAISTPSKFNQSALNRSLPPAPNSLLNQRAPQLTPSTTTPIASRLASSNFQKSSTPARANTPQMEETSSPTMALMAHNREFASNQLLRRRTPFPIVNQQQKGVFDRIVDVLIGDGPQDRFAMICKECFGHNGMALKEDFEYSTFRCAFCNVLNPARKVRPVAPRLSVMPSFSAERSSSDTSESDDDKADSEDEPLMNLNANTTELSATEMGNDNNTENNGTTDTASPLLQSSDSDKDDANISIQRQSSGGEQNKPHKKDTTANSIENLLKELEKSDSAIEDFFASPK